jgi:hypothetical protein
MLLPVGWVHPCPISGTGGSSASPKTYQGLMALPEPPQARNGPVIGRL